MESPLSLQPMAADFTGSSDRFLLLGITPPEIVEDEAGKIASFLDEKGIDFMHVRHPGLSIDKVEALIASIPERLHSRLALHDHFELLNTFSIGGIHLNGRHPDLPSWMNRGDLRISRSCHSIEEINTLNAGYSYATLSPIYNSISKEGYLSGYNQEELSSLTPYLNSTPFPVIALGGVTPRHIPYLKSLGFAGAAMLGHLWKTFSSQNI